MFQTPPCSSSVTGGNKLHECLYNMVLTTLQYTIIAVKIPVKHLCIKQRKKLWKLRKKTQINIKNLLGQ